MGDKDDATQFNEAQEVSNSHGLNEDDSEPESDLPEVEVRFFIFLLIAVTYDFFAGGS